MLKLPFLYPLLLYYVPFHFNFFFPFFLFILFNSYSTLTLQAPASMGHGRMGGGWLVRVMPLAVDSGPIQI